MKTYSLIALVLLSFGAFSQSYQRTQKQIAPKPSNQSLYSLEYELKHFAFASGDSSLLDLINLEDFISERKQSEDVELYVPAINQTIILYSFDRIEAKYEEKFDQY